MGQPRPTSTWTAPACRGKMAHLWAHQLHCDGFDVWRRQHLPVNHVGGPGQSQRTTLIYRQVVSLGAHVMVDRSFVLEQEGVAPVKPVTRGRRGLSIVVSRVD